jgi:translocation and assembly module TamA
MCKTQRMLLAAVACFFSTLVSAQTTVNVEIRGISEDLAKNVALYLTIEQQKNHPLLSEARLKRLHKRAPEEIAKALQPFGYYRPSIDAQLSQTGPGQWLARYTIDTGPPLPIGEFDFKVSGEMESDPEFEPLLKNLRLRKGDAFNSLTYENIKSELAKFANERGYFKARFVEHRVEVDLTAYEARIHLRYDSGPRYHFGAVGLQQDVLEPDLLRRYLPFKQGDPYTLNGLLELQQALNDSDYFRTVEVSPGDIPVEGTDIPIDVMLTPRKPHRYVLGLGYGTDTGARAKFGWEMPRLNRRGHRVSTDAKVSQIGYSLGIQYRVPVLNPRTDQLVYRAGEVNEKTDTTDSTVRTVGASLNRARGQWHESFSLNYQQEEYEVAGDHGISTLLMPGVSWSRTWGRDFNFIYTLDGLRFDIAMRGATDQLLSDTNFSQGQGGIKAIKSIGHQNRILARGQLGGTWTDEFHKLPSSVRFFAGGSQSVRGYSYQSLGPEDSNGDVVGGRYLMVGSIELEHRFGNKWGVAIFSDAGNAIDAIEDKLARGAGFGLRWQSPVGPVRIDLASAVSRKGHPWRIHINIGPDL